jgi:hypothetical protein
MRFVKSDYDQVTGITTEYWFNDITNELTIRKLQDVEQHIEQNKQMFNSHNRASYADSNGNHLVARIPLVMVENWRNNGFDWFNSTDNERRAWLDKPENEFLKVRPGRLGGVCKKPMTIKAS